MDLVANCPDPVRFLNLETIASHSHHTVRVNSTGGAVAWLLKLQSKMLGNADLLQFFPRDCHNITLYYKYYSKQDSPEMWLLWE